DLVGLEPKRSRLIPTHRVEERLGAREACPRLFGIALGQVDEAEHRGGDHLEDRVGLVAQRLENLASCSPGGVQPSEVGVDGCAGVQRHTAKRELPCVLDDLEALPGMELRVPKLAERALELRKMRQEDAPAELVAFRGRTP